MGNQAGTEGFFPRWIPLFWYFCNLPLFLSQSPLWEGGCWVPLGSLPFCLAFFCFILLYCDSIKLRFWNIFSRVHSSSVSFWKTVGIRIFFSLFFIFFFVFFPKAESITINNLFILMVLEAFSTPPRRSEKWFRKRKGEKKNPSFFS